MSITVNEIKAKFPAIEKIARLEKDATALDEFISLSDVEVPKELALSDIVLESGDKDTASYKDILISYTLWQYLFNQNVTGKNDALENKIKHWRNEYERYKRLFVDSVKESRAVGQVEVRFIG